MSQTETPTPQFLQEVLRRLHQRTLSAGDAPQVAALLAGLAADMQTLRGARPADTDEPAPIYLAQEGQQ